MTSLSSFLRLVPAARVARAVVLVRNGRLPPSALAQRLEQAGPAYIKLGQMLATRPDIVGAELATALEHLQDRLPPFADSAARAVIQKEFGKPVEALFSVFGPAIAAASIAQVHRAKTSEGVDAAVKVLRPGIKRQFARDLGAFGLWAKLAERFSAEARRLRFSALVETLAASVALELDLRM